MKKFFSSSLAILIWTVATWIGANAQTLETKNFKVKITNNCVEGVVGCDRLTYRGTDKNTGRSIKLSGKQIVRTCADRITPCQSLGYEFRNGEYVYFVSEDGRLLVYQNQKLILNEAGRWQ